MRKARRDLRASNKLAKRRAEIALLTCKHDQQLSSKEVSVATSGVGGEEIVEVRRSLMEQRRALEAPVVRLTLDKIKSEHLSSRDVQSLLLHSTMGTRIASKPLWCYLKPNRGVAHAVLILIRQRKRRQSAGLSDGLAKFFQQRVPMDAPLTADDFLADFLAVPLSPRQLVEEKMKHMSDPLIKNNASSGGVHLKSLLLLSTREQLLNGYPFPKMDGDAGCLGNKSFTATRERFAAVTADSPLFAVDCEMVLSAHNCFELARISVVAENGDVLMDTLVKPRKAVTDYLTKFSGITEPMLRHVRVTLEDVQVALKALLPRDAILCGHSLNFDLRALKLCHPYIIDLSVAYNLSGSYQLKSSLRTLVYTFLAENIQCGSGGHCSIEDAHATMRLARLKLRNGVQFGNVCLGWDYKLFARDNRIDPVSGKRRAAEAKAGNDRVDDGCAPPSPKKKQLGDKARRKEPHVDWSERTELRCRHCSTAAGAVCQVAGCQCSQLPRRRCLACLSADDARSADAPDAPEADTLDWRSALRVECGGRSQSLWDAARDSKCRLLLALRDDAVSAAAVGDVCRTVPTAADNASRTQLFREHFLECSLGILELDGDDSAQSILSCVERLHFSSAKRALIVAVSTGESPVCYVSVKK